MRKVAVVLCGSGFKDGSEIRESVATLWALSQEGALAQCFAPDAPQAEVVNCATGLPTLNESRNMLVESARISRGQSLPLTQLDAHQFDAVILPGGFGAAKNLCTFAKEGSKGTVRPELQKILHHMLKLNKPMGAICIAPAILALAFKDKSLTLTLGAESEAAQEISKLGHRHCTSLVSEAIVDPAHKVVTTPAYMYEDAQLHHVFEGIHQLVKEVLKLA